MLYIPYMAEEAEIILKNLILYFQYKYGEEVLLYFTESVKKEAQEDNWDEKNQRVVYPTDLYIEEEEEDKVGFKEAQVFITNQKLLIEEAKRKSILRLELGQEDQLSKAHQEAQNKVNSMTN